MNKELTKHVKKMAFNKGVDMIGVAPVESFRAHQKAIILQMSCLVANR